jgi:hypothetical protein
VGCYLRYRRFPSHADISITFNVYAHMLPYMGDAAAGAMDAALG